MNIKRTLYKFLQKFKNHILELQNVYTSVIQKYGKTILLSIKTKETLEKNAVLLKT